MKIRFLITSMKWIWIFGLLGVAIIGGMTKNRWFPVASYWVDKTVAKARDASELTPHGSQFERNPHGGHDHRSHSVNSEQASLALSPQGLRNIGLSEETIRPVKLETFRRLITVPARIVERPGRTRVQVATPMTGVITHVHALQGEAVEPGTLLFRIRLTHQDLVSAQAEFVKTLGELEIEEKEIARLKGVTQSGAVAGKLLLDREYARDRMAALLGAQREALRLHGLSEQQVKKIASERQLLRELQVYAPSVDSHGDDEITLAHSVLGKAGYQQPNAHEQHHNDAGTLILRQLNVHKGQSVTAGETLCTLTDYSQLFAEGMAFEQDISQLRQASENEWTVDAVFQQSSDQTEVVKGLSIAYLANNVDPDSRTLQFYVRLPNVITKDRRENGDRYVEWKYLPGQRLQLRVPVEEWPAQIVLPVDAVAREGAESFVFQQNGDRFDRVPVHVKYRDQYSAVIENDGSLFRGDVVALRGAHQMQMALNNKSGGGIDPHAGHNH